MKPTPAELNQASEPATRLLVPAVNSWPRVAVAAVPTDLPPASDDAISPDDRNRIAGIVWGVAEVISGRRPLHQLSELVTSEVRALLQVVQQHNVGRVRVGSLHLSSATPGVVEASARFLVTTNSSAVALRFSGRPLRCSALEVAFSPYGLLRSSQPGWSGVRRPLPPFRDTA